MKKHNEPQETISITGDELLRLWREGYVEDGRIAISIPEHERLAMLSGLNENGP